MILCVSKCQREGKSKSASSRYIISEAKAKFGNMYSKVSVVRKTITSHSDASLVSMFARNSTTKSATAAVAEAKPHVMPKPTAIYNKIKKEVKN